MSPTPPAGDGGILFLVFLAVIVVLLVWLIIRQHQLGRSTPQAILDNVKEHLGMKPAATAAAAEPAQVVDHVGIVTAALSGAAAVVTATAPPPAAAEPPPPPPGPDAVISVPGNVARDYVHALIVTSSPVYDPEVPAGLKVGDTYPSPIQAGLSCDVIDYAQFRGKGLAYLQEVGIVGGYGVAGMVAVNHPWVCFKWDLFFANGGDPALKQHPISGQAISTAAPA